MTDESADPARDEETQRRLDALLARFPDRFSDDEIAKIRERVSHSVGLGAKLRTREVANGIGPWFDPRALPE